MKQVLNLQYASRDIEENLVRSAYLKKLNKLSRRWFVLYGASSINSAASPSSSSEAAEVSASPAHLEWHNSEAKWRAKEPPKRVIVLKVRKGTSTKDVRREWGVTHSVTWVASTTTTTSIKSHKMPSDNICQCPSHLQDVLNILPEKNEGNRHVINVYTLDDCVSIMFSDEQEMRIWLSELLDNQKGRSEDGRVPRPNYEQMWQVRNRRMFRTRLKNLFSASFVCELWMD